MGVSDEYRPDSRLPRWPEPRAIGQPGRGRRILDGTLTLAGQRLTGDPFACPDLPLDCLIELHGFAWLDDLAAVAGGAARDLAREPRHRTAAAVIQDKNLGHARPSCA